MHQKLTLAAVAVAAALAGVIVASMLSNSGAPTVQSGTILNQPRPIPAFSLRAHDGSDFANADLQGRWSMIFVGFTRCPDICPATMGVLKNVATQLRESERDLQVLLLSVDPERDRPEQLAAYVQHFDPEFVGVTADQDELDKLAKALGFAFVKVPTDDGDYTIDHTSALMLIDPQARVAGYFTAPHKAAQIATDLATLIPASS